MNENDLELKLLAKDPIFVSGVPIYPISIQNIAEIGYSRFNMELRLLCLTASDIAELTGNDVSDVGVYTYLVANAMKDRQMMKAILFWLSFITRSKVSFSQKRGSFTSGFFEINQENFDDIQKVIRLRNGITDRREEEENPDNEAARRVLQRRKEERLKRKKRSKDGEEADITLADLVSILASGFGMTLDEIMGYDLYQFNDQFNRLKIMDDYEVSIQALIHGANKDSVNLTHWITKIKYDEE